MRGFRFEVPAGELEVDLVVEGYAAVPLRLSLAAGDVQKERVVLQETSEDSRGP